MKPSNPKLFRNVVYDLTAIRFTVNDFIVTVDPFAGNTVARRLICGVIFPYSKRKANTIHRKKGGE